MNSLWMTVVWERSNSVGKWFPYSGEVCQLLEQSSKKNLNSVCLGDVDIELKQYSVNLIDLKQVSEETGTKCQIRRLLFDPNTGIANQVAWQWKGDKHGSWNYYCTDVMNFIEAAYKNAQVSVDLSDHFHDYPYVINFTTMSQKNKRTRRHRAVCRIPVSAYPVAQSDVNGTGSSSDMENDSCSHNEISGHSQAAGNGCKTPTKIPLMKKMSNLWNNLMKTSDPDSDSATSHIQKKQKPSHDNTARDNKQNDDSTVYATVNGKPWTHPWPPSIPESHLKPVPGIPPLCDMRKKGRKGRKKETSPTPTCPVDVFSDFTEECSLNQTDENSEEPVCIICYEALSKSSTYDDDSTLIKLKLCSHIYHKSCMKAMFDSGPKDNHIQCPTCKTIHGVKQGNQPPGTMTYHVLPCSLPGHPSCDTIRIIYDIPVGIQGPEHPNPGKHYSARGFPRHCYLPDNEMGRKILRLLVKAWERKLIFTVGASSTTGEQNTVTWNEIHHKTEFGCNRRGHGYPDPNYFENIITELAAQGVTESTYSWYPAEENTA